MKYENKLGPIPEDHWDSDFMPTENPEKKYTPTGQVAYQKFTDGLMALAEKIRRLS